VVKIRYGDLPGGLHVRAVARGKHTVIYLLPGLTLDQRRAALRRVRSTARMGQGPQISAGGLTCAVIADRILTTARNVVGAMRLHPAMFVPLIVILLSAAVAFFLLSSVSIRIRSPQASAPETLLGPPIAAAAAPRNGGHVDPDQPGGPSAGHSPTSTPTRPGGRPSPSPSRSASPSPSPDPVPTGSVQPPGPGPGPSPSPDPSPAPSPSPWPTPSPTRPGGSGLCVEVGPLGVCLSM
jgi:hypothetical protein